MHRLWHLLTEISSALYTLLGFRGEGIANKVRRTHVHIYAGKVRNSSKEKAENNGDKQ